MKTMKIILAGVCVSTLVSSCSTAGSGAVTGAYFGGVFGSAVGGLMGGFRGRDLGTIVGMATGAAVGASAGSASERQREERVRRYHDRAELRHAEQYQHDDSGFDNSNSGDDRLYDFHSEDYTGSYSAAAPTTVMPQQSSIEDVTLRELEYSNALEIQNARFVDDNNDNYLMRGESGKIIFEILNVSDKLIHDVVPTVTETSGNRNILISPSVHIESIAPGQRLRYTAMVQTTRSLKDGTAKFALSVLQGNKTIGKVTEFTVNTKKK